MATQSTTYSDTNASTARTGSAATDTTPDLKSKLRHIVDTGKTRVGEWKGGFEAGIRERPVQSVLIAAAVGAVIGVLLGRRSR